MLADMSYIALTFALIFVTAKVHLSNFVLNTAIHLLLTITFILFLYFIERKELKASAS
jgi:hypothetical protein